MIEDDEQETIQSVKQPDYFNPDVDKIQQVTLLKPSEHSYDDTSYVQKIISTGSESSKLRLKPLIFTVAKNFFDLNESRYNGEFNKFIENRGLMQFVFYKDNRLKGVEFQFQAQNGFKPELENERHDLAKTKIFLREIESIFFNQRFFKHKIIIKLRPEMLIFRLAIDRVDREVILHISRKNTELAKQYVEIIESEILEIQKKESLEKPQEKWGGVTNW